MMLPTLAAITCAFLAYCSDRYWRTLIRNNIVYDYLEMRLSMASTYAIYFICALSAIVLDSFYSHVAILMICFFGYMVFLMSHKRVNRLLKNKMMQNLHFSSIGIAASFALFYGASSAIYPIVFAMLIFIQQLRIYQSYMKSIFMELGAMKRKLNGLEAARLQKNTFPSKKSPAKLAG